MRLRALVVAPIVALLLSACVSGGGGLPLSEGVRRDLGSVGVSSARFPPSVASPGSVAASGASAGAGGAARACLAAPPISVLACPALVGAGAVLGAVGGAVVGAARGPDEPARLLTALARQVPELDLQGELRGALVKAVAATRPRETGRVVSLADLGPTSADAAATYATVAGTGVAHVLETSLLALGVLRSQTGDLHLSASVRTRLVEPSRGRTVYSGTATFLGQPPAAAELEDPQALHATLTRFVEEIAGATAHGLFVAVDLKGPRLLPPPGATRQATPARADGGQSAENLPDLPWDVPAARPTLVWASFPDDAGRAALRKAGLSDVGRVVYDVRIWQQEESLLRGPLVYARDGLSTSEHTVEEALAPGAVYFWRVRARFETAAGERATWWGDRWGSLAGRFRTPRPAR